MPDLCLRHLAINGHWYRLFPFIPLPFDSVATYPATDRDDDDDTNDGYCTSN